MYNVHVNLNPFHPRNSAENAGAERAFFWSLAALLGSIHFLEEGEGGRWVGGITLSMNVNHCGPPFILHFWLKDVTLP